MEGNKGKVNHLCKSWACLTTLMSSFSFRFVWFRSVRQNGTPFPLPLPLPPQVVIVFMGKVVTLGKVPLRASVSRIL